MGKLGHYKAALYLSVAAALATCVLWGLIFPQRQGNIAYCIIALLIPFGLWLQSSFARYGGAAFMLLVAGSLIWPMLSTSLAVAHRQPLLALLFVITALLNLLTAAILLLSRKFATEFADRKNQPKYKTYLRYGLLAVIIGAVVIATANDIIHLVGNTYVVNKRTTR
jgi:hypothetical protein